MPRDLPAHVPQALRHHLPEPLVPVVHLRLPGLVDGLLQLVVAAPDLVHARQDRVAHVEPGPAPQMHCKQLTPR